MDGYRLGMRLDIDPLLNLDDSLKEKYGHKEFSRYIGHTVDNVYDPEDKRILFPLDIVKYIPYKGLVYIIKQFDFETIPSQSFVWSVYDREGHILVQPKQYDLINPYSEEGLSLVEKNGLFGYIDTTGKEVIPLQYADARSFSNGLAAVFRSDKGWGYINCGGKEVISCKYLSAGDFQNGLAPVKLKKSTNNHSVGDNNYSYVDTKGRVLKNRFQYASRFFNKSSYVVIGNELHSIDEERRITSII